MEITVIKRVNNLPSGYVDESLVPCFPLDMQRFKKIPENRPVTLKTIVKRNPKNNSKVWALCNYFVDNAPERYFYKDDVSGDLIPSFSTADVFYEWLKIRVGYCDVVKIDDKTMLVPKKTNFTDEPNELEYLERFHEKAIKEISFMCDMNEYDLYQASIEWRNEKSARIKR